MKTGPDSLKARGFTLMELLITVSVAAILAGIAAPNFQSMIQESRQESRVNELTGALFYARSEAIKRSSRVSVCARSSNTSCGTNWDNGWIVYIDNAENPGVIDAAETVLKIASSLPNGFTVTNNAIVQGSSNAKIEKSISFRICFKSANIILLKSGVYFKKRITILYRL